MNNLILIADISDSVKQYLELYIKTINSIIESQRINNPKSLFSYINFNTSVDYYCVNKRLDLILPIEKNDIKPFGMTAMYDCLFKIIHDMQEFYKVNKQSPPLIIILTDGDDNASRISNVQKLALQIAMTKAFGWKYVFLGVTEQSMLIGKQIGCDTCIIYNPTEKSFGNITNLMSDIFRNNQLPKEDLDLRELENCFEEMKM